MSIELHVYCRRHQIPKSFREWEKAMASKGLKVAFPGSDDPRAQSGFLPVAFDGAETGFELYIDQGPGVIPLEVATRFPTADACVAFRFTRADELRAAIACAAVLAEMTAGITSDPREGDGVYIDGWDAVEIARQVIAEIKDE